MSLIKFENLIRSYNVVLGALKASSEDICRKCMNLEVVKTKVEKGLKKLKVDIEKSTISDEDKKKLSSRIDTSFEDAQSILLASECSCQKTAGLCKIGGCLVTETLNLLKVANP